MEGGDHGIRVNTTLSVGSFILQNNATGIVRATGPGGSIDLSAVAAASVLTIDNAAGGLIAAADATAILAGKGLLLTNSGSIVGGSAANSAGVDIGAYDDVIVTNLAGGLIEGTGAGITATAKVDVTNAGAITASGGNGIEVASAALVMSFITNGENATIAGNATGLLDGDGIQVTGLVDLDNSGNIEAGIASSNGFADAVQAAGGVIANRAGAVIDGAERGIAIEDGAGGAAAAAVSIENWGTIQARLDQAIVIIGNQVDNLSNYGSIIGDVELGDGNDNVNLYTGSSIDGALKGGDGTLDVVNLLMENGSGDPPPSGTIANVSGFELLAVAGGSWAVLDTQVYGDGVEIVAGAELVLGNGGTGGALGGKIVNYGSFAVNRSDVFTLDNLVDGGGTFEQRGTGTTVIATANTFTGQTLITDGTLRLSAVGAVGSGDIGFDMVGGETLVIDDAAMTSNAFSNDVYGLGFGDAVDFTGLAFVAGTRVNYDSTTGAVKVIGKDATYSFTLLLPESADLVAVSDGAGGTKVMLRDVGATVRGTGKADAISGQATVLGEVLPTDADDKINGRNGDDRIDGLAGNDTVIGGNGDDVLAGSKGDDWLYGRAGSNKLIGGKGMDAFVFDVKLGAGNAGKGSADAFSFAKIKDFAIGEDQILLDTKVFKALDKGALPDDAFAIGKKAKADGVHILYQNGNIRYDADGKGGKDAVLFAKVGKDLAIDADDFLVI
jgi:autotransporter-associated beta strand protein